MVTSPAHLVTSLNSGGQSHMSLRAAIRIVSLLGIKFPNSRLGTSMDFGMVMVVRRGGHQVLLQLGHFNQGIP